MSAVLSFRRGSLLYVDEAWGEDFECKPYPCKYGCSPLSVRTQPQPPCWRRKTCTPVLHSMAHSVVLHWSAGGKAFLHGGQEDAVHHAHRPWAR